MLHDLVVIVDENQTQKKRRDMDTPEDRTRVLFIKLWAYLGSKLVIGKKFSLNRGNRLPARPMKTTRE